MINRYLPLTDHNTFDDRPVEMFDDSTLRKYILQMRTAYGEAKRAGDPHAVNFQTTHDNLMRELRSRSKSGKMKS